MTSLCRHLSAQQIVNWVTTVDGCVHTDDTTKLSPTSCEFVYTPHRRRDETRQFRLVGVGGVYWALAAAYIHVSTFRCRINTVLKIRHIPALAVSNRLTQYDMENEKSGGLPAYFTA